MFLFVEPNQGFLFLEGELQESPKGSIIWLEYPREKKGLHEHDELVILHAVITFVLEQDDEF